MVPIRFVEPIGLQVEHELDVSKLVGLYPNVLPIEQALLKHVFATPQ
jgi:hypothetical protein